MMDLWVIYGLSGLAVGLFLFSLFQISLSRLQDDYRHVGATQSIFFKNIVPFMQALAFYNEKFLSEKFRGKFKKKLVVSGNPMHIVPAEFMALKEMAAGAGLLFGIFLFMTVQLNPLYGLLLTVGGYFFPNLWLREMTNKRKRSIFVALPFTMDLLTLVVEAGMTFVAAIEEVVQKGQPGALRVKTYNAARCNIVL